MTLPLAASKFSLGVTSVVKDDHLANYDTIIKLMLRIVDNPRVSCDLGLVCCACSARVHPEWVKKSLPTKLVPCERYICHDCSSCYVVSKSVPANIRKIFHCAIMAEAYQLKPSQDPCDVSSHRTSDATVFVAVSLAPGFSEALYERRKECFVFEVTRELGPNQTQQIREFNPRPLPQTRSDLSTNWRRE
jgi:hypothetical protein